MPEKLVKRFTRDFSLFITEWWRESQFTNFENEIGVGFSDTPSASNALSISYFYAEKDVEAVKNAFLAKLQSDSTYYLRERSKYLKDVTESRALLAHLAEKNTLDLQTITVLKERFSLLYPFLRFANYVPAFWAEGVKAVLKNDADKTISAAFNDRVQSEGVFEAIDALLVKLAKQKLSKLGQNPCLAKFLSADELELIAEGKEIGWGLVNARSGGYAYCKGKVYATPDYQKVFAENNYFYQEEQAVGNAIKGNVAFAGGVVSGRVRLLFSLDQINYFQDGEILVSPMTVPDFMPAIKKAKAIVTDEGGITCHAAIVSRELKIPCVVATKIATKAFKNGELVEVDSVKGIVRKLS